MDNNQCCLLACESEGESHSVVCEDNPIRSKNRPDLWAGFLDDKLATPVFVSDDRTDAQIRALSWLSEQYAAHGSVDNEPCYYPGPKVWSFISRHGDVTLIRALDTR